MIGTHGIAHVRVRRARAGFWWRVGDVFPVTLALFGSTESGTYACCQCPECMEERKGKALLPVYMVTSGAERGSIILVEDCEDPHREAR